MVKEKKYSPDLGLGVRLKTIILLRSIAVIGQLLTCIIIGNFLLFNLPLIEVYSTIIALALSNLVLFLVYSWNQRLSETTTTIVIAADIIQLAMLIYFTGGLSNPFVMLFIVPIAISIDNLPIRSSIILIILTLISVSILGFYNYPLMQGDTSFLVNPTILNIGIWFSLIVTILFLSFYVGRLTNESREVSRALKVTEELLSNEQNLSSLDGLAAAAAHQLGTPLGTINLIAGELLNNEKLSKEGEDDLKILLKEISRCKDIIGSLGEKSSLDDDIVNKIELHALLEELSEFIRVKGIKTSIIFNEDDSSLKNFNVERRSEFLLGLSNIIENAAEFAKENVLMRISSFDDYIELLIEDDGDGFSSEIINRLGDPYVTSRKNTDSLKDGLGLGFFISKTLFERLGIRMNIYNKSKPEYGAVVSIMIPKEGWV
ncbi:MAG: ActS/PrrB/RegB family redox-sensitive histidine kinase [Pseudomonadota bacterium]|nr:ActS/PrrB/RegB family redox-sensitive histidine kinase [Pseudomonadota bacterium]MEC9392210.1 ActS/PrrB/RegB family redox-sensitive histidine kinase [Pseudomonadota bacterium]MEC9458854.1 ActS/PrrB/RegB family redox-sensitive histidine kinase [Pseudomonadota bacterium]MEC9481213.1 ActS/PrrB/RegB family redox-sensitive histidine kinase [Pseudomonadota bacterium]